MKIALINDSFICGRGSDQVVFELAKRLGSNHEVIVIAGEANFPEENFKIKKLNIPKLLTGTWRDFLFFYKLFKFRQASRGYDIINLHHASLAPAFWRFSNVVVTYHGSPFNLMGESNLRKFLRTRINHLGLFFTRQNQKTIAISDYIKKELIKFKFNSERIKVIYNGVGKEFRPNYSDEKFMLFVGRHYKHKRIDYLIKLSKEVNFPLKIVGNGPETKNLKRLAKEILAPVEFLDILDKKTLISYYQRCSFFVSASLWEGFGLIFLEAARCGKTSVAFNIGSLPEIIHHNYNGFLANNYYEFKKYVKILIKDKNLRNRMGQKALSDSQKFDWEDTYIQYLNLFKQIVNNQ